MLPNLKSAQKVISTRVVGGIGNQLFCYFAGFTLAKKINYDLKIDVSDIRQGRSVHEVSIESFHLPGDFISVDESYLSYYFKRIFKRLIQKFSLNLWPSSNYQSKVIGYDPNLEVIAAPTKLNGYFQTFRYFERVSKELLPLKLKSETEWFKITLKILQESNFVSIHIRRGDYEKLSQNYGLLSADYYRRAIEKIEALSIKGRYVIFSDDIDKAREVLSGLVSEEAFWIDPPENVSPVESLMLMSHATANIIANSTFSWWGAALNIKTSAVIAPSKWFRNLDDPQDLYPLDWHLIESSWEP
jgi:hypothetical protein